MDKISSIVPSNARVTTVDLKPSGVSRSGAPGFGRDVNTTNLDRLHHPQTANLAIERHNDQMAMRQPTKDEKADIVAKLSDKFFSNKAREDALPEIKPNEKFNIEDMEFAGPQPAGAVLAPGKGGIHAMSQTPQISEEIAEDLPSVGGRLDVRA